MNSIRHTNLKLDGIIYKGYLLDGFSVSDIEDLMRGLKSSEPFRKAYSWRRFSVSLPHSRTIKHIMIKQDDPLKRFQPLKWIKNLTHNSNLARTWEISLYLISRGLPTPMPIGFFEKKRWGVPVRSYMLSEFIPEAQELNSFLCDPSVEPNTKEETLSRVFDLIKSLHGEGLFHSDLNGTNILVGEGNGARKIYFIDFDSSNIYRKIKQAKKIRDISRLTKGLMVSVCRKDRQGCLKRYFEGQKEFSGREDILIRRIETEGKNKLIKRVLSEGPSALRGLRYGIKKILVIKLRYIGDTLLMTPLLDALKDVFPDAAISALVNRGTEAVLFDNPLLEDILILDRASRALDYLRFLKEVRGKKFDLVIDLTDADRSAFISYWSGAPIRIGFQERSLLRNSLLYNLLIKADGGALHKIDHHLAVVEAMGHPVRNRELRLFLGPEEIEITRQRLNKMGLVFDRPYVVFHPGARRWYKSWPSEYFSELGKMILKEYKVQLVLAGSTSDHEVVEKIEKGINLPCINLAGTLNLRELACLLKMAALCVVNDSSPMHIAAAVGTPTIALFGLTDYRNWYPRGKIHAVFSQDCPCRPYGHSRECDQDVNHCMRKIRVEEVFEAVKARLDPRQGAD